MIEDLDVLWSTCTRISLRPLRDYLQVDGLERPTSSSRASVFGRFIDPEARKVFFEGYKEIEALWEILSP